MKHEDLIKKLENLKTPEIELPGHRQALKMALLSSGRFKERTIMDWAKILAPVATAVLLIAVVGVLAVIKPGLPGENQISKFSSHWELQYFIKANAQDIAWRQSKLFGESDAGFAPPPTPSLNLPLPPLLSLPNLSPITLPLTSRLLEWTKQIS